MAIAVDRLRKLADGLAIGAVATIPWSTSIASIFLALWLIAVLPGLDRDDLRDVMRHPAAWLAVALFVIGAAGMLWADVAWKERIRALEPFARFLLLPVLLVQFRRSDRATWIFGAFLVSCTLLLAVSFTGIAAGGSLAARFKSYGVPVRDYIAQSGEFILCAAGLFYVAMTRWSERRAAPAFAALALAALFLANVFYIAPSRTALVTVPILLVLFAITQCRWSQMLALLAAIAVLGGIVWVSSAKVQERITGIYAEIQTHRTGGVETSAGQRVEFWRQSLRIVQQAPVLGHGTGSLNEMFKRAAAGERATATSNPHNQVFTVAIQIGLAGTVILFAMWLAHAGLFLRGAGLAAWIGLAIVVQNVVGCLFNNHLFDFVQAWLYLFGVGAAGGLVLRQAGAAPSPAYASGGAPARP